MSDLRDLTDAFAVLEQRADAAPTTEYAVRRPRRPVLAPVAAAAAVVVTAAGIAIWQYSPSTNHAAAPPVSQQSSASASAEPSSSASPANTSAPSSSAPSPSHATTASGSGRYQPPTTEAELTAKTREILAGTATITVTDGGGQGNDPAASGSTILGQLTSGGQTGGYLLNVFTASRATVASCESDLPCTVHHRPDGSTLAVATYHDRYVSGGITREVEFVRADQGAISLLLSNEADPKGQSTVTASHVPLTAEQIIEFVTSPNW